MRTCLSCLLVLVLIASASPSAARDRAGRNLIGGELLGRGVFLTVNYERYLTEVLSVGAGLFGVGSEDGAVAVVPLYAAGTFGGTHALYLSGGVTVFAGSDFDNPGDDTESDSTPNLTIGYQFLAESGLYVRPTFTYFTEFGLVWPGVSIGGSF